jgi:hypothetical protein
MMSLFPGYMLVPADQGEFTHCFGGEHTLTNADCVCCGRPLMQFAFFDPNDGRLPIREWFPEGLRIVYCMQCSLCWSDFAYRVVGRGTIEVVEASPGPPCDDWDEYVGKNTLPRQPLVLRRVPERVNELFELLNADTEIGSADEATIAEFTGNYADPEVGGYPIVDIINQIGGRSFLCQRNGDPLCPYCVDCGTSQRMRFLVSLTNEPRHNLTLTFDDVQIMAFVCPICQTLKIIHRC